MSPITKSRIEELRKMESEATQAEWEYAGNTGVDFSCSECGEEFPESGYAVKSKDEHQVLECHLYGMKRFAKPDGELIAASRNSLKYLLDLAEWALETKEVIEKYIDVEPELFPEFDSHLAKFKELK